MVSGFPVHVVLRRNLLWSREELLLRRMNEITPQAVNKLKRKKGKGEYSSRRSSRNAQVRLSRTPLYCITTGKSRSGIAAKGPRSDGADHEAPALECQTAVRCPIVRATRGVVKYKHSGSPRLPFDDFQHESVPISSWVRAPPFNSFLFPHTASLHEVPRVRIPRAQEQ